MGDVVAFPSRLPHLAPCHSDLLKLAELLQSTAEALQRDSIMLRSQVQPISSAGAADPATQDQLNAHIDLMQMRLEMVGKLCEATLIAYRHSIRFGQIII